MADYDKPYLVCADDDCGKCPSCRYNDEMVNILADRMEAGGEYGQMLRSGSIDQVRYDRLCAVLEGHVKKQITALKKKFVDELIKNLADAKKL